ncbi:hypothetical protein Tco_0351344 [Tanacetum coccineum]
MWESPPSRVILFGDNRNCYFFNFSVAPETSTIAPVISSAAPMVETTLVASPTGLCGLDPLMITTVAHWRSRVTTRPSSSSEFPIAPITAPPGIRRRPVILIRPEEAIPLGRAYCTHLNGPHHHSSSSSSSSDASPVHSLGLDAPDQTHSGSSTRDVSPRLCYPLRRAPRHSKAFCRWCAAPLSTLYPPTTSESSSGDSSERPMHSSPHSAGPSRKRCRSPVDSVSLSMPVTGSLAPTRADHLPPRKRFRDSYSSEASIEEDAEVGLTGTGVDMELGIGDGDEVGDHVGIDHRDARDDTEEYEADASTGDTAEAGIDPMTAPLVEEEIVEPAGEDSPDSPDTRDGIVRSVEDTPVDLSDAVRDFYHHMSEVRVDRIVGIETAQGRLEADQLIASGDRARMAEMIYSLRLENLKVRAMLDIERDRVSSLRLHMSLSQEEFRQIRRDRDDARGRLRRTMTNTRSGMTHAAIEEMIDQRVNAALEAHQVNQNLKLGNENNNGNDNGNGNGNDNGNGNGNDNGNGNGNDNGNGNGNQGGNNGDRNENHNVNGRGDRLAARECTYQDFMKCPTTSVKGTKEWLSDKVRVEKMETSVSQQQLPQKYQSENLQELQDAIRIATTDGSKVEGYACEKCGEPEKLDNNY